ncbi:MAG: hypothetical protein AAF630_21265 [Cyanobacteria bacterium P01_C01_bin.38]
MEYFCTYFSLPITNYQLPTTLRVHQLFMGETPKTTLVHQLPITHPQSPMPHAQFPLTT